VAGPRRIRTGLPLLPPYGSRQFTTPAKPRQLACDLR
jgi:hypothetical protein